MNYRELLISPQKLYSFFKKSLTEYSNRDKKLRLGLFVGIHNCKFGLYNFINANVSLSNTTIGDFSYVNANTIIANTSIGKFCSIGNNVQIGLGGHPSGFVSTHPSFYSNSKGLKSFADKLYFQEYKNVTIENDVWIGNNAILMGGVKIGNGAIVAAGSVVTKDVLPYSIVGGVPAKLIKYRFPEEVITRLIDYQWWNKSPEWIQTNYKRFHNIDSFIDFISQE